MNKVEDMSSFNMQLTEVGLECGEKIHFSQISAGREKVRWR